MKYFKVKPKYDQTKLYKRKNGKVTYAGFLIGDELYTEKELKKLLSNCIFLNAKNRCFEPVEVNKNNIYWFFGARFEKMEG